MHAATRGLEGGNGEGIEGVRATIEVPGSVGTGRASSPAWRPRSGFTTRWLLGIGQTLGVIALFVGVGLAAGWLAARATGAAAAYAPTRMEPASDQTRPARSPDEGVPESDAPQRWLVDGFNVLHAGVLQGRDRRDWWTAQVQARLIAIVATFDDATAEVWVVFDDARPGAGARCSVPDQSSRVRVAHAPSADDWIVREVRSAEAPGDIAVVTADRQVRDRCRHRGARIVSPLTFLARCDRAANASDA